jgi:hypothetical protein
MVSNMFPFRPFSYDAPVQQHHRAQFGDLTGQMLSPKKIMISRNFAPSGDGKSLLHQTFDTKIMMRNAGAPLRTAMNMGTHQETFSNHIL